MAAVELHSVVKRFGRVEVIHGIDLAIGDGELVVLVGPSGCGKSTSLRMIAGLETPDAGEIRIAGRVVNDLEPKERNIAMVFQNYAIYPHMTVARNIGFGLKTAKLPRVEKDARIRATAELLGLVELLERRPAQLSGGQRQRVAIGRALVRDPAVFLFDEPLSNLDAQLRAQMRLEIKKLHQRLGTTIVFVTHDQVEAMTLADRIVVMRDGHILQIGTPAELWARPSCVFVARFIGSPSMNVLEGRVAEPGGAPVLELDGGGALKLAPRANGAVAPGRRLLVGIRPDHLRVVEPGEAADAPGQATIEGRVTVVEPLGGEALAYVEAGGRELIAKVQGERLPAVGAVVRLGVAVAALHLFDAATEQAL